MKTESINIALSDVRYLHLAETVETKEDSFVFYPEIALPVQITNDPNQIDISEGISIAQIASGIIKVLAYDPTHEHIGYYTSLLLALQPDIVHELQIAAAAKGDRGELGFAIELYLAALRINRLIPEIYVNLATLYARQAKKAQEEEENDAYDAAIQKQIDILREGLENLPSSPLLLSEYGLVQLFLGNSDSALEYLTRYLAHAPEGEKKDIIERQVTALRAQNEDEKTLQQAFDEMQLSHEEHALTLIDTFLTRNDDNWSGHFIRGWALRRLRRYEDAQEAFLKCLSLGADSGDIYNELSICALETENRDLAADYLEIALEKEEGNLTYISNLALLYLQDSRFNEAADLILRARAIDPDDPMIASLVRELSSRGGIELPQDTEVIDG